MANQGEPNTKQNNHKEYMCEPISTIIARRVVAKWKKPLRDLRQNPKKQ